MIRPQTFVSPDFSNLADGDEVVIRHYIHEGSAFNINQGSSDITLDNITVYGCPGMGFGFFGAERRFRLSNSKTVQRPCARRLVSATADGAHFARTKDDIVVENCDFSGQGDDSVNIHGNWLRVRNKLDARTVVIGATAGGASTLRAGLTQVRAGDELNFSDPQTLEMSRRRPPFSHSVRLPARLLWGRRVRPS